jgi:hypothetical protein
MKRLLQFFLILFLTPYFGKTQITTPIIKANFGIDADLRCNYFSGLVQTGNDDWFRLPATVGSGEFVIDTTGAAAILAGYASNPDLRKLPFYRSMRFPAYSKVNNRLLIDAIFVRDYHGDDSTIFASGSNKNGMSPADWSCPVSQSVPDKNEILDMMLHVRRAGPNTTDSLWLMAGLSIENTTGNRYFDFEMYQTDIYYDRASRMFYNYGPDAGHTTWQFDASGNMIAPGDIILTAEYSSSSLTNIEARIWINKNDLAITPANFNWSGSFDGANAGAQFGYAGIQPKSSGAFYTGLQSTNNTWAGPFQLPLGDNSVQTNYTARQYMEFSVNFTKLGLDYAKIFGGDDCVMPFRRLMAKTRASTSFTAELKDFVAPFDFFLAPRANVESATPMICDTGSVSNIYVTNPIPTSIYQWSTINGRFLGTDTGTSVYVDTPGVYIVKQYLQASCGLYASDTINIGSLGTCVVLANNLVDFQSSLTGNNVALNWKILENQYVRDMEIERSTDGFTFKSIGTLLADRKNAGMVTYSFNDDISSLRSTHVYYRVQVNQVSNKNITSKILSHQLLPGEEYQLKIFPNPVKNQLQVLINSGISGKAVLYLQDQMGREITSAVIYIQKGSNTIKLDNIKNIPIGIYQAVVTIGNQILTGKILLTH